jgi:hypothetical protein
LKIESSVSRQAEAISERDHCGHQRDLSFISAVSFRLKRRSPLLDAAAGIGDRDQGLFKKTTKALYLAIQNAAKPISRMIQM